MKRLVVLILTLCLGFTIGILHHRPVKGQVTTPPTPIAFFYNGAQQINVKCGLYTGTTASNGTATINISAMGYTSVFNPPVVNATGVGPYTTNATSVSTTSVSILITQGSLISIAGINILSFGGASVPYSMWICGV